MKRVRKGKVSFLMLPIVRRVKERKKKTCGLCQCSCKLAEILYFSEDGCMGINRVGRNMLAFRTVLMYLGREPTLLYRNF